MFKDNDEFSLGFTVDIKSTSSGKNKMQTDLISKLMTIDPEGAKVLVKCWEQLVNHAASGSGNREFLNLDVYVPWRILDVGETYITHSDHYTGYLKY